MKKKNVLKRLLCLMAVVALLTPSTVAFAQNYSDVYVNGNSYGVVAEGTMDDGCNYITVVLTEIMKADGSESNYKKVLADVCDADGNQISILTDNVVKLQKATLIPLMQTYPAGTRVKLRMMGNNIFLDCIVSFSASITE